MNVRRGFRLLQALLRALPSARARSLIAEAWRIERSLPRWLEGHPLPQLMQRLDREAQANAVQMDPAAVARCADSAVMLDYFSPLGVCLRRSLVRYVMLRRAGVPVVVHFGARKNEAGTNGARGQIAGHAWLTLDGVPFSEDPQDYRGFTSIYSYPPSPSICAGSSSTLETNLKR